METANSDLVKEQFANSSASIEALIGISGVFEQKPPFIGKIVAQKLAEWEVSFPADYIKFISLTDGCMIGQCKVVQHN